MMQPVNDRFGILSQAAWFQSVNTSLLLNITSKNGRATRET